MFNLESLYCILLNKIKSNQKDDHTGIFTCDGCARDPYFYVPNSAPLGYNDLESATLATAPGKHSKNMHMLSDSQLVNMVLDKHCCSYMLMIN